MSSSVQDLKPGDFIFINDGTVKLEVLEKDTERNELVCEVKTSGKISDNKGCNLPSGELSVNVVTEKDAADLDYIAKNINPEYVAASFIGTGDDVKQVRSTLVKAGNPNIKIIAKLERPIALENLEEIILESDAISEYDTAHTSMLLSLLGKVIISHDTFSLYNCLIVVARGDLGVEIEAWDVPAWQKKAAKLANKHSKPVIVATQMLER